MNKKINWIKMNKNSEGQISEVVTESEKEEKKMSFFKNSFIKKGILFGVGALATGLVVGLLIKDRNDDLEDDEEDVDLDEFEDAEFKEFVGSR